jgi:hypothetical protein
MYDNISEDASKISKENKKSIYQQLDELPPHIADEVTSEKTGGGRALDAIWDLSISSNHKIILLYLGSKIDFRGSFQNQYVYHSVSKIAKSTGISQRTVERVLNGCNNRDFKKMGLIEMGFVSKRITSKKEQIRDNLPNEYALTSLLFDTYIEKTLIPRKIKKITTETNVKRKDFVYPPVKLTPPPRQIDATPPVKLTDILPSSNPNIIPVCNTAREETSRKQPTATHTQNSLVKNQKTGLEVIKPSFPSSSQTIPKKLCQDLARVLNDRLNRTFSDANDCDDIIDRVIKENAITVDMFKDHLQDICYFNTKDIFSAQLISKNKTDNLPLQTKEIAKNLSTWIQNKDTLKRQNDEMLKKKASESVQLELEKKKKQEEYDKVFTQDEIAERMRKIQELKQLTIPSFQQPIDSSQKVRNEVNLNLN